MTSTRPESTASLETLNALVRQYGCGPVPLTGTSDALYERHLFFDNVADPATVGARERYEALARSIRDVLSQRWVLTEQTYRRENPKRVYYLSMEFLIGRSLANNITNLLVSPFISEATKLSAREWLGLLEAEPDAGLGNGGLGRLAACFLDSMATMQLPAMGYGLRYEYGMFRQSLERGWQREQPDNWLRRSDPWEVARPDEKVEVNLNCSFEIRQGALQPIFDRPSTLIGVPFDRPVVGYGGKTINTLRLWAAAAPDFFDFQAFSHGQFVGAVAETLAAESLTRVLYPDDSTTLGQGLRFVQEYFLVACSLAEPPVCTAAATTAAQVDSWSRTSRTVAPRGSTAAVRYGSDVSNSCRPCDTRTGSEPSSAPPPAHAPISANGRVRRPASKGE